MKWGHLQELQKSVNRTKYKFEFFFFGLMFIIIHDFEYGAE